MTVLLETNFAVVLFCVNCDKLHMEEFSSFLLLASGGKQVFCACGKPLGWLKASSRVSYELSVACDICGDTHKVAFSREIFAGQRLFYLNGRCLVAKMGFAGSLGMAQNELAAYERQPQEYLAAGKAEEDSVMNPQIMFEVINKLDDLAANGHIYCRECGSNSIGIEIFPDFVRLFCFKCESMREINAINQDDVNAIKALNFIELLPNKRKSK